MVPPQSDFDFGSNKRTKSKRILSGLGLVIQMLTLTWSHPLAFLTFLLIGTPLVAAGTLFYLYSLVASGENRSGTITKS